MEAQFWIDSWHIGDYKTSFHRRDIHPYLFKHLPPTTLQGKRVLVPLCGKTLDLVYFRAHAAHVIGVELVEAAVLQFFAKHHNKIQFFGYEVANLVLVAQQLWVTRGTGYGLNLETMAALALLLGSAFIWRFDPKARPHLLFYGGIALAVGGAFFTAAGYAWTGLSIILSALETARGGLSMLSASVEEQKRHQLPLSTALATHWRVARWSLHWYCRLVAFVTGFAPSFGRFIDERPFITSTLIKAPLRFEFIAKKLLSGDPIGAAVGLSWLFLGDLALAFNDIKLQAYAQRVDSEYTLADMATEQA